MLMIVMVVMMIIMIGKNGVGCEDGVIGDKLFCKVGAKITVGGYAHDVGGEGVRQANEILLYSSTNTLSFVIKSK